MKEIATSQSGWLLELTRAYKAKEPVRLVDDARIGINPETETLLLMGRKAHLSPHEWSAVLVCLGVSGLGAYLLVMAILDPEPFSKIAFALGTGALLVGTGGFMAVKVLTKMKPPSVRVTPLGFEIDWT
jgi:hypothetical protein